MKDAVARAENEATVQLLQGAVDELELQENIHRQLLCLAISASTRGRIVSQLTDFFATRLAASQPTLCQVRHELEQVEITGDASAPVVRMDCSLRGRLIPATVRQIYPHIIGKSVLLDRLIHEDMVYACQCWFYFSPDGTLENHVVEMDGIDALHRMLGDLRTVRDVIADIGSV